MIKKSKQGYQFSFDFDTMIPIIYVSLLLLMLFVLFRCGKRIAKTGSLKSKYGVIAIVVYTLNEGLRFGRGVDYNGGWIAYESVAKGYDFSENIGFLYLEKLLIYLGLPWQACVIVMSFVFIIGLLFLMKLYREVLPIALPIFVLLSIPNVENMARWYMAYSIFMIGFSIYILKKKNAAMKLAILSVLACSVHYAFLPIPIIFLLVAQFKKPFFSPIIVLSLYFVIGLAFKADFMLGFTETVNILGQSVEKFSAYGDNAEYWLTGGRSLSAFPSIGEVLFSCAIVWLGFGSVKSAGYTYILAYNLFVIGLIMRPIGYQIELLDRFCCVFYFFRAIVLACILKKVYVEKALSFTPAIKFISLLIFINFGRGYFQLPFVNNPKQFMYIWDYNNETPEKMKDMWASESDSFEKKFDK